MNLSNPPVTIRRLTSADIPAIDPVLQAAYGGTARRADDLRRYLAIQPDGWLIATRAGQPIGMVGAADFGAFAYLGLMAVDPRAQRQGAGRQLLRRLLAWLDERGCPQVVLDATAAGAPLYRSEGFVDAGQTAQYLLEPSADFVAPEPERISLLQPGEINTLAALDLPIFGADRTRVFRVYREDLPGRALVSRDETGAVDGYLFAQAAKLGPWVARTPQAAERLLHAALQLPFDSGPRVIVPACNPCAERLLTRAGFRFLDLHQHMLRGKPGIPGRREQIYGQASFGIG